MWVRWKQTGEALALVLLFSLPLGTPSAVSRLYRGGLLGHWPQLASGMVRWKVGSLESEFWVRGLGKRGPKTQTLGRLALGWL